MQKRAGELASKDGSLDPDAAFMATQNARLVKNAERYYREMFASRVGSWNLRDQHMVETLDALVNHLGGSAAKIAVWAHNSHLGDARATEMGEHGEWNVGELARLRYGNGAVLVALRPTPERSRQPRTGTLLRNESACGRPSLAVTKSFSMRPASPLSC